MPDQPNITYAQLVTLLEVSRKINSQLNLQMLLDEIMDLAIGLLHAEKGLILLRNESKELTVQVARHMDKHSIADVVELSRSIIKKVEEEGKSVLLQNVPDSGDIPSTSSMIRYKIKSVICVPLRTKNKLIGTIYLDTTKSEHFFKKEDLEFLEGFANLAGIAVENAKNYQEVEELVKERTSDLETAYEELQATQTQLIRSEKMASLGQLVAGVAHEINTPLGSISSNADMFISTFAKLRNRLQSLEDSPDEILKPIKILEDLSQVNKMASDRIKKIVGTLKNFARLDEEEFKIVDIHEGIDSTLSLTAHLYRDRIEVVKEYGNLPKINCHPSQLNQVFMNTLVNACQSIKGKGTITIKTRFSAGNIHLQFSDTGVGIAPENLAKIFDPGFTTKGVGVGTGLGLSISYKIIEEHGGKIDVYSKVGQGTTFTLHLPLEGKKQKGTV